MIEIEDLRWKEKVQEIIRRILEVIKDSYRVDRDKYKKVIAI